MNIKWKFKVTSPLFSFSRDYFLLKSSKANVENMVDDIAEKATNELLELSNGEFTFAEIYSSLEITVSCEEAK